LSEVDALEVGSEMEVAAMEFNLYVDRMASLVRKLLILTVVIRVCMLIG
jgi:hypothetical protein